MSKNFKTPDFSGFGIIDNSFSPVPEAFLIKEIAEQNIENYNNKNYFDLYWRKLYMSCFSHYNFAKWLQQVLNSILDNICLVKRPSITNGGE